MRTGFFFLVATLIFLVDNVTAQQYRFHHYRVEQGLPSDVIKSVTQDSLGFIWIATDDGLVKYDGLRFHTYKDAVPGQYVKGFLHTADKRLIAFGDLSAVEIVNQIDTVTFKTVVRGDRFLSDSTLFFPKSIFQDRRGNIWFGEPKSVARFNGKHLARYDFGEENRSGVFVRSFSFFEDDAGVLYTISYNGNIFRYSHRADKFRQVGSTTATDISAAIMWGKKLLLATRNGLMLSEQAGSEFASWRNILPVEQISNLLVANDSSIYVTTYGEDVYQIWFTPEFRVRNLNHNFNGINSCFLSDENDLWVATDKGVILVQRNLFVLADQASQTHFIEGITFDNEKDRLFYCSKEVLSQLERKGDKWESKRLIEDKNGYFQCLQYDGEKLWASTRWEVVVLRNGREMKRFDFSAYGNFVHDIFLDSKKHMWLSQAGTSAVRMIDEDFNVHSFEIDGLGLKDINVIREGRTGLYLATSGLKGYLYFKPANDSIFRNISVALPFVSGTDFNVSDIAVDSNDVLWLATTDGLVKYSDGTVSRVAFEPGYERYPVTSVEVLNAENILFSNSFGLFRYHTPSGEYWLYDENTGLPSNTITDHGIFVADGDEIWIGSSYGIARAERALDENIRTRRPHCVEARVNGVTTRFMQGINAPFESFVTLRFSPISFPESRVNLQWRFKGDDVWRSIDNNQLEVSNLKHGTYTIQFRAKKNTGLTWSEENSIVLVIQPPYWRKPQFGIAVLLLVGLIAWASYATGARIVNKRKQNLEAQINERTHELRLANEELKQRNAELDRFVYSASHDLSAPLKSILGLIRVAKMDDPPEVHQQYLDMMERSVLKLELFIQEVVTYSRNARMPVRFEGFDFESFVKTLLQDHEYSDNYRRINFVVEDRLNERMVSDVTRMKIILNNLLSNAIKFHWIGDGRKPMVKISVEKVDGNYVLTVSDNGRGIPDEHIKRIFEMFYRASEETQGSGLGLYILKESVVRMGGTVDAESRLEHGTTFTIKLPVPQDVAS